jgi:hypothetical protein
MTEKTSIVTLKISAQGRVAESFLPAIQAAFAHLVMACQMAGLDDVAKTLTIDEVSAGRAVPER